MPGDEELYELYLAACERGEPPDPGRFLERHPHAGEDLRERLEMLYRFTRGGGAEADPDLPFRRLGPYLLVRRLERGGMGEVYVAEAEESGRRVALKVIRPELRGAETALERFRREGKALAKLDHPNIVRVLDSGEAEGVLFLAMEFVRGKTLDRVLEEGTPPTPTIVAWMRDVAAALDHAHSRGIVHRDVKPSNILIGEDGTPHLLDFGIARGEEWLGPTLTRTFAGSPLYSAPEQLRGDKVDGRADLYALGVTFYQAVTGAIPFEDVSGDRLYAHVLRHDPVAPCELNPALPRPLELVVLKALAKRPADRYATGAAFKRDLQALLDLRPVSARPPGIWTRSRKWARRRPRQAAAFVAVAALASVVAGVALYQGWAEASRLRDEGRTAVAAARAKLQEFRERRRATEELELRVVELRDRMVVRYLTDEEVKFLDRQERAIEKARTDRERSFHEILGLLRRAERRGVDPAELDRLRLDLYLERIEEAQVARDPAATTFYSNLADGLLPARMRTQSHARVAVTPSLPDASVYLFRIREQADIFEGGELRRVPEPYRGGTPVPPGTWTLRVVRGAGDLRRGDLVLDVAGAPVQDALFAAQDAGGVRRGDRVRALDGVPVRSLWDVFEAGRPKELEIERDGKRLRAAAGGVRIVDAAGLAERGGVRATVYRDGEVAREELPAGLGVRTTAIPLFTSPASRLEHGVPVSVAEGQYLVVVRHPDTEEIRYGAPFRAGADLELNIPLQPRGLAPEGFVYMWTLQPGFTPYWIMEREVTLREYLEFLDDPAVQQRIDAARPRRILEPWAGEVYTERGSDGRYKLHPDWSPDWPVLGVTWEDARAYAEWRTERARREGLPQRFDLATQDQWVRALSAGMNALYPFGPRFRPRWVKSCYARRRPWPEPVLRFPIDESLTGVYDMCGSATEWLVEWYDTARNLRMLAGGNWAIARPELFTPYPPGREPTKTTGELGFRLVMTLEPS